MNHYLLVVILFGLSFVARGEDARRGEPALILQVISTGRGAITAVQSGTKWVLKEMPYTGSTKQQWYIRRDHYTGYAGSYISTIDNMDLVWDTKGYQFSSGTPVVLYQKKSGLVETKNQRWRVDDDNRFAIIYDYSMVANVTHSGDVVLAKIAGNHQKFMLLSDVREFTVYNYLTRPVNVSFATDVGNIKGVVDSQKSTIFSVFSGSRFVIKDLNGTQLHPFEYFVGNDWSIRIPPLQGVLPVGSRSWSGSFTADKVYSDTFSATFASGVITGSGSNEFGGSYTISGKYQPGGDFSMYFLYASPVIAYDYRGILDATVTSMNGNWSRNGIQRGTFQFTLL